MSDASHSPTHADHAAGPASRERLIEAAARVYATAGFRGATTRRIADEAGVNEVTIFRLFGSKASLIEEAVRHSSAEPATVTAALPDEPRDPEAELTAWCSAHLAELRRRRLIIRQAMGEMEEKPDMAPCAAQASQGAAAELKRYMVRLFDSGLAEREQPARRGRDEEAHAAGAMLMAALFGDAMGRDVMPDMYPQPAERAAALYARLFLRAIRCRTADEPLAALTPSRTARRTTGATRPTSRS